MTVDREEANAAKRMEEVLATRPDKEKEPEAYATWQAEMLKDCTVIKMDPESSKWKAYMADIQRRLELKRGLERPSFIEVGYRVYN